MTWPLFLQLLIAALVGFASAYLAHRLSARRDHLNARRNRRIEFLIDAYRKLEFVANRPSLDDPAPIEKAIADIQLFGTPKQVESALAFAHEFAATRSASLDKLPEDLRGDLRKELQLEPVQGKLTFLRWEMAAKPSERKRG